MSAYDRFTHDGRPQSYPAHAQQAIPSYPPQETPRFDPHGSLSLPPPQVLGHAPSQGNGGTTFSVQVTDLSRDPRIFKFVFGQKQVGAFLESTNPDGTSILVAQIPRLSDTNWWNKRVPVYLMTVDRHTGEEIHTSQICEFTYQESPSVRKRARDDIGLEGLHMGSPIKRPNSQPVQQNMSALPTPTYASLKEEPYMHRSTSQPYAMPYMNAPVPQYRPTSYEQQPAYEDPNRYIAEPRDHYPGLQINPQQEYTNPRPIRRSPSNPTNHYYQPAWRPPQHASNSSYVSPPPSSTLSKTEIPFPESTEEDDGSGNGGAPMLQRTSTLSSDRGSSRTPGAPASWIPTSRAKLEVIGDLDDMARNWTSEEFTLRRRLVQIWRKQEGNIIKVNFRPLNPNQPRPLNAVVISCIYWEERQECFFTSVDAIYVLESIVGNRFAVEEKNRIRRNLEGFRPLTVSKGKPDSEEFFKLIMAFPAPKPRNIEKDVKAFPWRILTSALRKIIGKYSANYGGLTETAERVVTPPTSAEMPPPSQADTHSQQEVVEEGGKELSITVPPLDFERRLSVPLSGISNLDFSEFMGFPNASPGLFPPPSATFRSDSDA